MFSESFLMFEDHTTNLMLKSGFILQAPALSLILQHDCCKIVACKLKVCLPP